MFFKCWALTLCICCLITILKLEELEALPLRSDDARLRLAKSQHENVRKSRNTDSKEAEVEALPVLAHRGEVKVELMGGLAPGIRLFPINAGYPEEASRNSTTREPKKAKKSKTRRPATKEDPKLPKEDAEKPTDPPKELTISVPAFKTDVFGQWVYNPWGATFGKVWQDTRFHVNHQSRMPRLRIESDPGQAYYPDDEDISTVCHARSTVYNQPEVFEFMRSKEYKAPHKHRPIFMDLRREHYRMARSEECHTSKLTDFLAYQNCALQRNQRMEYMLPFYPRQQLR